MFSINVIFRIQLMESLYYFKKQSKFNDYIIEKTINLSISS